MTVSLHRFGNYFFPGTGDMHDIGKGNGKGYSINIPLREGCDDDNYAFIFQPLIKSIVESYEPNVIVLQCGADSLGSDRLGCFNLSFAGHGACVRFVKNLGIPLIVLGGGGYTLRNVARCWAYETSIIIEQDDIIDKTIPLTTEYREFFGPEYTLTPDLPRRIENDLPRRIENGNSKDYLLCIKQDMIETIRSLKSAPSVQLQPEDYFEECFTEYLKKSKKNMRVEQPRW
uniref:Histone deacetylase domain-containing protein n=1 Tax=Panagrolaimus sp. ES5 TaxID=591445 RepID=A0AC34G5P8_9BILA